MPVLILEGVTRFAAGARQIFAHTHPRERWVLMLRPTTKRVWLHTHFVRSGYVML